MRHAIALTLLQLRKQHGPGYVKRLRLNHFGKRPRLSETLMYDKNGDAYLLYSTPANSIKAEKIISGGEG